MILLKYLDSVFPQGAIPGEREFADHFLEKFGVDVKVEGDLYLFKYNMLLAKWTEAVTHQCRGTIVRRSPGNGWRICSLPWDKFFNHHEGHCRIWGDAAFTKHLQDPDANIVQKVDGTCIQVWYDTVPGFWRVSTLGSISTGPVNRKSGKTFEQLFWEVAPFAREDVDDLLGVCQTYLFELCTEENRIITRHAGTSLFLLSARGNSGGYASSRETNDTARVLGVARPRRVRYLEMGATCKEDVLRWVEDESSKHDVYGQWPEGFVCYDGDCPVAKIKNKAYLGLVPLSGADPDRWHPALASIFFAGKMDDVLGFLNPEQAQYVERVRNWYSCTAMGLLHQLSRLADAGPFPTQKDYALAVNAMIPSSFRGMCFQNKDAIVRREFNLPEVGRHFENHWETFKTEIVGLGEEYATR